MRLWSFTIYTHAYRILIYAYVPLFFVAKTLKPGWCPLCFGLLQGCVPLDIKKMLEESLSDGGFTNDGLCVCFSLPCSLSVRQAAFETKWVKSEAINVRTTVVDLKQAIRWAIGLPSESCSICGGLRAEVNVTCPDADAQVANMLGLKQCASRKRKKGRGGPRGLNPGELSKSSVERKLLELNIRGSGALARAADEWFGGGSDGGSVMKLKVYTRVHVERDPILVTGRYRKLSRCMPQSPWVSSNYTTIVHCCCKYSIQPLNCFLCSL